MAPRKHSNGASNSSDSNAGNDVSSSSTISATSATDSIVSAAVVTTTSSVESPSATALFNTAVSTPTSQPAGLTNAAPSSSSGGQSSTSVKIIGGIAAALIGILIIFSAAIFYLKRRWRAKEQADARRTVLHDAKARHDEEEGGGEGTAFMSDKKAHNREDSMASTRSKSSADDYLKSGRKRSSIGTYYTPGIAADEAYMMFGGSTADLNEEEEKKPLTYQQRHLSESSTSSKRSSWGGMPAPTDPRTRRISLLDDDSRYPLVNASTDSLGRRQMRHSVSYPPGVVDPFSDATITTSPPTTSPKAPSRALTTGDITNPGAKPGGPRPPPAGAQAPMSPEGRRVSLKGGVGVRQKSSPGSPGSPRGSPRAAWK